jgi:gluconate kinase
VDFRIFFSWFNDDLRGFDPGIVQHNMKTARQNQKLVYSALKATFREELKVFLKTQFFSFVHPKWISNWKPASKTTNNIITCVSLQTFRQAILRNPFLPLSMNIFLQQVVESQLDPFLGSLFG